LPLSAEDQDAGATPSNPRLTAADLDRPQVRAGQADFGIGGRTTTDASAIAFRFRDLGSGYWVVPVQTPDPVNNGEFTWKTLCDFSATLFPGNQFLRFVAIDSVGSAGTQLEQPICIERPFNDNFNACSPTSKPPGAVLSLTWDANVDLDIRLVTPNGTVAGGKQFSTTSPADGGISDEVLKDPSTGILDRDSNRGCVDGARRENIIWQGAPQRGHYMAYANLFDACSQAAVRFKLTLYLAASNEDGTWTLVEQPTLGAGELLRIDANGGASLGLFVKEFDFQ